MKNILRIFLLTLTVILIGLGAFADDKNEALNFFSGYVRASNSYSASVLNMYSKDANIIRQVVKPNGTLVNVPFSIRDYKKQLRLSSQIAKIKNYKNYYSNISVTKVSDGYKIDAMRKPSLSDYKLKASMTLQKQPDGSWLIVQELMQTKEQIFLKYAK